LAKEAEWAAKKKAYLDNGSIKCPYCESDQIEAVGMVDIEALVGTQMVKCLDCDKRWTDVYRLVDVVEE
jgi:transposase-like protein